MDRTVRRRQSKRRRQQSRADVQDALRLVPPARSEPSPIRPLPRVTVLPASRANRLAPLWRR